MPLSLDELWKSWILSGLGFLLYKMRNAPRGDDLLERCLNYKFLFLDDFGAENTTDFAREQFFTILDIRCQKQHPTYITTNLNPKEIREKYGERIFSRLKEMAIFVEIKGEDKRNAIYKKRSLNITERIKNGTNV
jgi:DNA replication protein